MKAQKLGELHEVTLAGRGKAGLEDLILYPEPYVLTITVPTRLMDLGTMFWAPSPAVISLTAYMESKETGHLQKNKSQAGPKHSLTGWGEMLLKISQVIAMCSQG